MLFFISSRQFKMCHFEVFFTFKKVFFSAASPPDEALPVFALLLQQELQPVEDLRAERAAIALSVGLSWPPDRYKKTPRALCCVVSSCCLTRPLSSFCVSCPGFPDSKKMFFLGGEGESDGLKWCPHKGDLCPHACVHGGQPTVILRVSAGFAANAWICARRATDRAPESVFAVRKANAWICARRATDRALQRQREFFCECLDMRSARATNRALESVSARFFVRMLGHVLVGQPTVIFRVFSHVKK